MQKKSIYNKKWRVSIVIALAVALILFVAGGVYINDYYRPLESVKESLVGDDILEIYQLDDGAWVFTSKEKTGQEKGLIFYPGGKVAYEAYAPLLRKLAKEGFLCILPEMPGNLAVLDMDAAKVYPPQFPEITQWYLGGHSLGGSMAASYVAEHTTEYKGLILLAAYSTVNLTESGLQVLSIYGSEDKVLNMEKYLDYKVNLPYGFEEKVIEGGSHAYFGCYGPQEDDGTPTISNEEQLQLTVEFILDSISR